MKLLSKFKKLKRTKQVLIGMVAVSLITGITVSANIGSGRDKSVRVQKDENKLVREYQETVVETFKETTKEEVEETDFEIETEVPLKETEQKLAKEDINKQDLIEKRTPVPESKTKTNDTGGNSSEIQSSRPLSSTENQNKKNEQVKENPPVQSTPKQEKDTVPVDQPREPEQPKETDQPKQPEIPQTEAPKETNPPAVDIDYVISAATSKVSDFLEPDGSKMNVFWPEVPAYYTASQMVDEIVSQYRVYQQHHNAKYFRIESGGQNSNGYVFACYYGY